MAASAKVATHSHHRSLSFHEPAFKAEIVPPKALDLGKRPHHTRRKSSKLDGHPVAAIRHAFKRVLPKSSGNRSFNALALDFYTVAIGLTAGVCITDFALTYFETVMLALELSHAMDTSNVLLIVNEVTDQLFVIHTHILSGRMDNFPSHDKTIFAYRSDNTYIPCRADDWNHFDAPLEFLKGFLRQSTRQVLQPLEFGWSPLEVAHNMGSLSAWLLEYPVVCLDAFPNTTGSAAPEGLRWHLNVRLEGYEPRYDHSLRLGSVPSSMVNDQSLVQHDHHGALMNLSVMQDRVQTAMFNRFNSNETASVWSDITTEWVPSDGSTLLDA